VVELLRPQRPTEAGGGEAAGVLTA
jgi:hypothetical protein